MREVIERMLVTEEEARKIISASLREADTLMAASRAKTTETEEKARREVQEESARLVSEAEREAKESHDAALERARAEAKEMTVTGARREETVKLVMKAVLGGEE